MSSLSTPVKGGVDSTDHPGGRNGTNGKRGRSAKLHFPNLQSRLILGPAFRKQTVIPPPPPRFVEMLLRDYEKRVLKVDASSVEIDKPVFIASLPRSGTSMLQDILAAHPDVAYFTNTMHSFRNCFCAAEHIRKRFKLDAEGERYLRDGVRVSAGSPSEAIAFWGEWLDTDPMSIDYDNVDGRVIPEERIQRARETVQKAIWSFGGNGKRFLAKVLGSPHLKAVHQIFPEARFVHIVRDARMAANSLLKLYQRERANQMQNHGWTEETVDESSIFVPYPRLPRLREYAERYGLNDLRTTAHIWNDWINYARETMQELPHVYEVKYEDILADPPGEIAKLLDFCELRPVSGEHLDFWKLLVSVGKVRHQNLYAGFEVVEDICRDNMKLYGYLD